MTAVLVTERLGLQKEIDTRNMNSVEADHTTGIDAAVSQAQQTAKQFQTKFEAEQSLESETDQHRSEQERDNDTTGSEDLLEEGFHWNEHTTSRSSWSDEVLAEQRFSSSRCVSILTFQ